MRRFLGLLVVSIVLAGSNAALAVEPPMTDKAPEATAAVATVKPKAAKSTSKGTRSTRPAKDKKAKPATIHKSPKTVPAAATTTGVDTTTPQAPTGKP